MIEGLLPVCVFAAVIFWSIRWVAYERITIRTPADWSIAILVLMIPVALWATAIPEVTTPQVYRLLTGIAVYYAIVNWARSGERIRFILVGLVLLGVSLSAYAIISVEWPDRKLPAIISTMNNVLIPIVTDKVNPNVLAGSLALILPLLAAMGFTSSDSISMTYRIILWIGLIFISTVLFLTFSRGAFLALGITMLVFITLRWKFGWIVLPLAGVLIAGIIFQYGAFNILDFLFSGTSSDSVGSRVQLWSRAVLMIQYFPFTGVGMGAFSEVVDQLFPLAESVTVSIPHAHNLLLQVGIDLGIPGLIGWLASWFLAALISWRIYSQARRDGSRGDWLSSIGIGLLCSQLVLILHGMTDAVTWGMVRTSPLVWAIWGCIMVYGNLRASRSVRRKIESAQNNSFRLSVE